MKTVSAIALFALAGLASASFHVEEGHALRITTRSNASLIDSEDVSVGEDHSEDGWLDMPSYGLMMERSPSEAELAHLLKRGNGRDTERSEVDVLFDERGEIAFPRSWEDLKDVAKVAKRKSLSAFSTIITWYNGHDLLNPACQEYSHWNPTDSSMICALTETWPEKPPCGSFLQIRAKNSKKTITVRVIDACAGCKPYVPHVDLTTGAFQKLYNLNLGLLSGLQVKVVKQPFSKWTSAMTNLYGPQKL